MWPRIDVQSVTMGSGAASSGTIQTYGANRGMLEMPDAFTGTLLTFNGSVDGTIFRALYTTANAAVSQVCAGSRSYPLPSEVFNGVAFTLTAGTVQAAARSFRVSLFRDVR